MLKKRPSDLTLMPRFLAIVGAGVLVLAPFTLFEHFAMADPMPFDWTVAGIVLLLALVPSIGAFVSYAKLVEVLGPGRTGVLLYLAPLYNAGLAWIVLDERLQTYHLIGAVLIVPGLYFATVVRRRRGSDANRHAVGDGHAVGADRRNQTG